MKSVARFVLLPALVFGVLGPLLGAVLFFGAAMAISTSKLSRDDFEFMAAAVPWSYALAGVPAILAGALIAALARRLRFDSDRLRVRRLIAGAVVGGVVAGLWQLAVLYGQLSDPMFFLKEGAFAGGILTALLPLRYWQRQSR